MVKERTPRGLRMVDRPVTDAVRAAPRRRPQAGGEGHRDRQIKGISKGGPGEKRRESAFRRRKGGGMEASSRQTI